MAQALEEFLVSLKWNIDASSSQRFFDILKRTSTQLGLTAGAVSGLTVEIVNFAEKMAKVGDQLYWMSGRLGDSVNNIQATAQAFATLGMSSGEAYQNMERFGLWMRSYGPAATGLLRSLGVTATDTTTAMEQLGKTLYARGLRPGMEGSLAYAMQLQYLNLIPGVTEQFVRTMPQHMARQMAMQNVANMVWGGAAGAGQGLAQFGGQSNQMILQFARLEALFVNIAEKMALNVFPAVSRFIDQIIAYGPRLVEIFTGIGKAMGMFVDFVAESLHFFHELPDAIKIAAGVFLTLPTALRVLMSPLGMVIAGFTSLFLLMDDYKHWQEDQKNKSKDKHSLFDWGDGSFLGLFVEFGKAIGQLDDKGKLVLGAAAGIELLIAKFGGLKAVLGPLNLMLWAATTLFEVWDRTQSEHASIEEKAKAMGFTEKRDQGWFSYPTYYNPTTHEEITTQEMLKRQGLPTGRDDLSKKLFQIDPKMHPEIFGALTGGGRYQLAALGDSWMPPSAFGSGDTNAAEANPLFRMLRDKFDLTVASLNDIYETLTDMATAMGAGNEARTGTGAYGPATMGGPAATSDEQVAYAQALAKRLGIPLEAAAAIVSNLMPESGLQPGATSPTGAHGAAQWIRSRWGPLAVWARQHGFDPESKEGQREMLAHDYETNFPGLLEELKRGGDPTMLARRNYYEFEAGHDKRLLTPQQYYLHERLADPLYRRLQGGGGGGNSYHVSITITSPSPAAAGAHVADAMTRVFQEHSRMTATALG